MATNQKFVDWNTWAPVPEGTKSGDLVVVGARPGVALIDRDANGGATIAWHGQFEYAVTATTAIAAGSVAYYNPTTKAFAAAAASGFVPVGYFMAPVGASTTATVPIALWGFLPAEAGGGA